MRSIAYSILLVENVKSMFINNSTISFKLKYPNLADLLDHYAPGVDASSGFKILWPFLSSILTKNLTVFYYNFYPNFLIFREYWILTKIHF